MGQLGALTGEMQATSCRLLASCRLPLQPLPTPAVRKPFQPAEQGVHLRKAAAAALAAAAVAREVEAAAVNSARSRKDAAEARQSAATAEARAAEAMEEVARLRTIIKVMTEYPIDLRNSYGGILQH